MNKFTRLLAPLALAAATLVPSFANAATTPATDAVATTATASTQTTATKSGDEALAAKWHRRPEYFGPRLIVRPPVAQPVMVQPVPVMAQPGMGVPVNRMHRFDYGQRFEHGHRFERGRFEYGRR